MAGEIQRNATAKTTRPLLRMHLNYMGREIRNSKNDFIPNRISTILEMMNINHEERISQIRHYGKWYYRVIGHANNIKKKLKDNSQKWFHGIKQSSLLYKQQPKET